jgi:ZIP family zinc transporter
MSPSSSEIWTGLAWGAVSCLGLVVGAVAGYFSRVSHYAIAMGMSVGAGLLLAAISLKLAAETVRNAKPITAVIALLLGAAVFSTLNAVLARFGAAHRKRCGECMQQASESLWPGSGAAIALGTALDAVPDVLVLGLALRKPVFPASVVIALAVSNLPKALSGATGMRHAGRSYHYIFFLWGTTAIGAAVLIAVGYAALGSIGQSWPLRFQAFGAGALLATTAETMIPEAFHNSPRFSGLLGAVGFSAVLLVEAATS